MKTYTLSIRRILCLLLTLALSTALFGCSQASGTVAAEPPTTGTQTSSETPEEGPAAAESAVPGFYLTAEYDRLYFAPLDGSAPSLLVDKSTVCTVRWGGWFYASFDDGSVSRISLEDNSVTELVPAGGHSYRHLVPYDGGVVGMYYSFTEGAGYDLYRYGSQTPEQLVPGEPMLSGFTIGKCFYNRVYDRKDGSRLVAYDIDSLEELWEVPVDSSVELIRNDDGILCFIPNSGKLFRLDEDAHSLVPLDTALSDSDYEIAAAWNGTYLVEGNWSDGYRKYIIDADGRHELGENMPDYLNLKDQLGSKALLYYINSGQSAAGEDTWYSLDSYKVIDLESREISEFPVTGEYGRLFAAGDFPVMDSSTARKPVTSQIYAFFCESTGAGGTLPLCSTTHYAWLNIANRAADVALLAAPTQEEQDYLNERGVSVEMKLYGGDGLVFIGNKACGVEDLSLDQVRAIYRGEITNWAQLGGADHEIRVLYRDDQSGSQRLFERMVWKDEPVPDFEALGCERLDDMSTIVSMCLYDPYAIGYSIMTYLNDVYGNEDLLAFSLEGYEATPENVAAKNYPLGTQGYVVIRADEPEGSPARRLFDWFGSPLSDVILTRNGVTPLHDER